MKKIIMGSALVVSVCLMGCSGNDSPEVDKSIMPEGSATTGIKTTVTDSGAPVKLLNAGSGNLPTITAAPPTASPAIKAGSGSAANPAHGQPGHRCDIAVGAPLNSPATTTAQPKVQTVPSTPVSSPVVVTPAAATPASSNPNAKLNPAHGQPGHDCAIAVGAPLKKN